jgi:hypothetical protein
MFLNRMRDEGFIVKSEERKVKNGFTINDSPLEMGVALNERSESKCTALAGGCVKNIKCDFAVRFFFISGRSVAGIGTPTDKRSGEVTHNV